MSADYLPAFCKRCGCCTLEWIDCWQCGGEGHTEPGELYEDDPLWYSPGDTEPCHICAGNGGWNVCGGRCDEMGTKHAPIEGADPFSHAKVAETVEAFGGEKDGT